MEFLQKVIEFLSTAEGASVSVALVLEFVFRLVPSKKPLSVLFVVAKVSHVIGDIFSKIGKLLDKVLPQNSEEKE